jgi:hypothetical protein
MQLIDINGVESVTHEEKDEVEKEEEEKRFLLEIIKVQNEALKRIYKNTLDKETKKLT